MLIIIAQVAVQPAQRDRFTAATRTMIPLSRKDAGCLAYDCHQSVSDPDRFVWVERWENRALMDQHMVAPHMRAFLAEAMSCLAAPPIIEAIYPASIELVPV